MVSNVPNIKATHINVFDKKQNEFVLGFGAEHPTSGIEDKLPKGYPDALLAT